MWVSEPWLATDDPILALVVKEERMRNSVKHPTVMLCPECGDPLALSHLELASPYYRRVFKCITCGHCDRISIKPISLHELATSRSKRATSTR
jgi:uncharacterized protein with PIN domain